MVNLLQILFPLYIYPTPGAWDPLYTSISANPSVQFNVVVNPNSGPGDALSSDYIDGLAKLNSYNNTQLFGYVRTAYASRPEAEVKADVTTYGQWTENCAVDGIFFDEAVSNFDETTGNYMSSITTFAKDTIPDAKVIFNPGVNPSPEFYQIADIIVASEITYNTYSARTLPSIPEEYRSQAAVVLYYFSGSLDDQKNVVNAVASSGVGNIFISDQEYKSFSSVWTQFVSDVASADN